VNEVFVDDVDVLFHLFASFFGIVRESILHVPEVFSLEKIV
jgi:hypothetical protein